MILLDVPPALNDRKYMGVPGEKLLTHLAAGSAKAKCGKPKPCFGPCWSGDTLSVWMYLRWKLKTKMVFFLDKTIVC